MAHIDWLIKLRISCTIYLQATREKMASRFASMTSEEIIQNNFFVVQCNDLLTTPHGGFSVTIQLRKITMVSKKTKISSKTIMYVCMYE